MLRGWFTRRRGCRPVRYTFTRAINALLIGAFALGPAACNRAETLTTPDVPLPSVPLIKAPFPDSVTTSRGLPPRAGDSTSVLLGDTIVQTSLSLFGPTSTTPAQVALRVFVRDTSVGVLHGRTLGLAACPFSLRLYATSDRSTPPIWVSDNAAPPLRCPTLAQYDLSWTDLTAAFDVPSILGDSLPASKYAVAYTLRLADGRSFEFAAGSVYLTSDRTASTRDLSAVRFSSESEIVGEGPRTLRTVTTLRNSGARAVSVSYGACNTNLRLYRSADRQGTPVWRSEYRKPPGSALGYACILPLYITTIAPGDSLTFPIEIPMYEVVADSLAAGRYYVSAELSLIDEQKSGDQETVIHTLSAGAIDITRDPDPLPASRTIDGLTYAATTRLVHGSAGADTVRTLVLVTNQTPVTHSASVSRDCPIIAYPYRSAARRDSVPIQPPVSYPNRACSIYPYPFALGPGQSWVFGLDVPVAAARAALGTGQFWFTAWMPGSPSVTLAAGNIEIAAP
jgi:hypothetical protein